MSADIVSKIEDRFVSGNSIPVPSIILSQEDWDELLTEVRRLETFEWEYEGERT